MGAYVGAFFIFAYIFISKNKLLSLLSAPIIGTTNHAGSRDVHQFRKSALCHICAISRQE